MWADVVSGRQGPLHRGQQARKAVEGPWLTGGRPRGQGREPGILVPLCRGACLRVQAADVAVRQPSGRPASHTPGLCRPQQQPEEGPGALS